jgi:hypothetical protein
MTDHAHWLTSYQQIRIVHGRLKNAAIKELSAVEIDECAERLGLAEHRAGDHDDFTIQVLYDYAVYDYERGGRNAVQSLLDQAPPPPGSFDREVLEAMRAARYTIGDCMGAEKGVGVAFRDLRSGATSFLMDIALSQWAKTGTRVATRLVRVGEIVMTSGVLLPVRWWTMKLIQSALKRKFGPVYGDLRHLMPMHETEFATISIREACARLIPGQLRVSYLDLEADQAAQRRRAPACAPNSSATATVAVRQVGRNTRCPCGSGEKYKHCCGNR